MDIAAFDPGQTTGVAVGRVTGTNLEILRCREVPIANLANRAAAIIRVVNEVVIEKPFNSGPQLDMSGFEAYGFLKHYSVLKGRQIFDSQPNTMEFVQNRFPNLKVKSHWGDAVYHLVLRAYRIYNIKTVTFKDGARPA